MVTNVTTSNDSTVVHWAIRPIEPPPGEDVGVGVVVAETDWLDWVLGVTTTLVVGAGLLVGVTTGGDLGVPMDGNSN